MAERHIHSPSRWIDRFVIVRGRLRDGLKWWAEHQAWPATDDVRIDRHHRGCC